MHFHPRPEDADKRIQEAVAPYLGAILTHHKKQQLIGALIPILWDAGLDDDEVFFRTLGGMLVQVWNGHRVDGPDWVKSQPSDLYSPSPPIP